MDQSLKRRLSLTSFWASSRISVLDSLERYEDSFAITQEFCEWITCLGEHPEQLKDSVLQAPIACKLPQIKETNDTDEVVEI